MKLAYITNTGLKESSGGGSGVNFAVYSYFKNHYKDVLYHHIEAKPDIVNKLRSVLQKKVHAKRIYHHFSNRRLAHIAGQFKNETQHTGADAYFFHGFTQWSCTQPDKPYYCFNDACFATYVEIYNDRSEFKKEDLERIYKLEATWLRQAEKVFFRSQWALEETKKAYNLSGDNFVNVGVGGFIDIPEEDSYKEGYNFLFISREFIPKGGEIVVKAIQKIKEKYPSAKLWIVGEKPEDKILDLPNIDYLGFFRKNVVDEKKELIKIFKNAFAIVHPTLKDTNTLVINELAYHGCPAIASNRFAIPEYLLNAQTGYLLNDPRSVDELVEKMDLLLSNAESYSKMRKTTRNNAIKNNTWEMVLHKITNKITN
ncbi:glycosyltransferase family 4 protein [Winogradskyella arenosi]|uniref:Glycosyltransferase involved in cell wall biosynthesis n=1 Tax=Winogradskyella arenosi TaxID=533325 RepID=A0A368ZDF5_9FLAO|nr:glycosyltransferase family 4 protein [Winogradskyella arenosi]RCW90256.1 glycosyltransferase involved in cell wall biosynthesis [Winogradskyella arenosi]